MLIFDDCKSAEVEAIVRRVLLGFTECTYLRIPISHLCGGRADGDVT